MRLADDRRRDPASADVPEPRSGVDSYRGRGAFRTWTEAQLTDTSPPDSEMRDGTSSCLHAGVGSLELPELDHDSWRRSTAQSPDPHPARLADSPAGSPVRPGRGRCHTSLAITTSRNGGPIGAQAGGVRRPVPARAAIMPRVSDAEQYQTMTSAGLSQ